MGRAARHNSWYKYASTTLSHEIVAVCSRSRSRATQTIEYQSSTCRKLRHPYQCQHIHLGVTDHVICDIRRRAVKKLSRNHINLNSIPSIARRSGITPSNSLHLMRQTTVDGTVTGRPSIRNPSRRATSCKVIVAFPTGR